MRRFAALALIALTLCSCRTLPDSSELKKEQIYREADYFALIRVEYSTKSGRREVAELAGFLINHRGNDYVVTAGHIHDDDLAIRKIEVWFKNNKRQSHNARLLGYDSYCDTAVLGLDPNFRFTGNYSTRGNSDSVRVGDRVYSLGHPNGNHWYISKGRVRDTNVERENFFCLMIEHSAVGGPGSSGGPLLNTDGQVIGMNIVLRQRYPFQSTSKEILAIKVNDIYDRLDLLIAGYRN